MSSGIVQILPIEGAINQDFGVPRYDRVTRYQERFEERVLGTHKIPHEDGVWLHIDHPIRRQSIYVFDAKEPWREVSLKFSTEAPGAGRYQSRMLPRGKIESGVTVSVQRVDMPFDDERFVRVNSFEERFIVHTKTDQGPIRFGVWVIGFTGLKAL